MAKRYRRNPDELIRDLQTKIGELEKKAQAQKLSKDPAVKVMRLVRMYLRKALGLVRPGGPFTADFIKDASSFLEELDTNLMGLGARRPRRRRKGG